MSAFDFSSIYYGYSYVQSGTLFRVDYGDGTVEEFRGSGFAYNAYGEPIAGTVTSYAAFYNGQRLFYVEGGSIAATKIAAAARTYSTTDDAGVIIEILKGNDSISGGNLADLLYAYDGNDTINGNGGNDVLLGYAGNDTLIGGVGQDRLEGGAGFDTASYSTAAVGVTASLIAPSINTNDAKGDTYIAIENLLGSRFNDVLFGSSAANTLNGGDGNDALIGGAGGDQLIGGNGTDAASYANAAAGVIAKLSSPSSNTGDAKGDSYSLVENLIGSNFADQLFGTAGANGMTGGGGNDIIAAGSGNDWLYGGGGADSLYGGLGADRHIFQAISESSNSTFDTIFDFNLSEQDKIDLSAIDASTKLTGNQAFSFVGTAAFNGSAGQLRYEQLASDTYIYADVNGDKVVDLKIHLDDAVTLTKDYFIL
ncbi:protease [Sinorhizobium terangae]|uniref:Protease n=2 Tax=Sinorhizobium terangae TaxID=110322 RepID=A0A6N7LA75_SINTE|nr:protease [Sinorhizobium terangae]